MKKAVEECERDTYFAFDSSVIFCLVMMSMAVLLTSRSAWRHLVYKSYLYTPSAMEPYIHDHEI